MTNDISTDIVDGAELVTEVAPTQKRKPGRPAGSKSTPKASKLTFKTFDGDATGLFFQVTEDVGVFYNVDKTPLVALSCASPYPVSLLAEAARNQTPSVNRNSPGLRCWRIAGFWRPAW